jgi:hypothetical protein
LIINAIRGLLDECGFVAPKRPLASMNSARGLDGSSIFAHQRYRWDGPFYQLAAPAPLHASRQIEEMAELIPPSTPGSA